MSKSDAPASDPNSSDRVQRFLKMIYRLQSGEMVTTKQLAEECGVAQRTIFRDIKELRDFGLQIEYNKRRKGYEYRESRFLLPTDLTPPEILALITLCQQLASAKNGIAYMAPAQSAAFKLLSRLPRDLRKEIGDSLHLHQLRMTSQAQLEGTEERYRQISQALQQRHPLQIRYTSFTEQQAIKTRLKPYRLYYCQRSWYVIGHSSLHKQVRTFHLKRFESIKVLSEKTYRLPSKFRLEDYFGNAWNMIREPDQPHHVVIQFAPLVASNVAEVQWHKTQRVERQPDGSIHFHVDVEGLTEIVWWILGYGNKATVLEPPELRERILTHAREMVAQYESTKVNR